MIKEHNLSIRVSCKLLNISTSVYYYKAKRKDDSQIIVLLDQLVSKYPTYGFKKLYRTLRLRGYTWNHKRIYRIYKLMGLNIKRRPKKRLPARVKAPLTLPITQNIVWSMDFMSDSLIDGRRFRTLNIIDDFNREALWITIAISINAHRLIRELNKLIDYRGKPEEIRVDNGPEFTSLIFIDWAKANEINIRYIQPGKPMQNSLVERFNKASFAKNNYTKFETLSS
ncbi:IS3 family transposase [Aquimarina rhabdastrellae]